MTCQLTCIDEIKKGNSRINDLLQTRVKVFRKGKRRAIFLKNKLGGFLMAKNGGEIVKRINPAPLRPGDIVRVRPRKEIRGMLDDHEKYKGCLYIDEMFEHCGKTYRVLKTVGGFFDEAKQKMCKCGSIVILEGVVCSGRQRLYRVSCDRNCFFFWHKDWLERMVKEE